MVFQIENGQTRSARLDDIRSGRVWDLNNMEVSFTEFLSDHGVDVQFNFDMKMLKNQTAVRLIDEVE